jgi:low affinity Fe/Cu permease
MVDKLRMEPSLADQAFPSPGKEMAMKKEKTPTINGLFSKFANKVAWAAGSPVTFGIALAALIVWAMCGPFFDYSQAWQLLVNTGTTITTILMVFVIQNSQNRDGLSAQIKLDEIIRAVSGAKNSMIDLECLSDEQLAELRTKFAVIAERARTDEEEIDSVRNRKAKKRKNGHAKSLKRERHTAVQ